LPRFSGAPTGVARSPRDGQTNGLGGDSSYGLAGTLLRMGATWRVQKDGRKVTGAQAVEAIGDAGETWFECEDGRRLSVTSNGKRALVMLLREVDDEGEHAIDPDQSGQQDGYILDNGQNDVYANRDTVALDIASTVVEQLIDRDERPAGVRWQIDRAPE
jgi:hypothetical protein